VKNIVIVCFFAGILSLPALGQQGGDALFSPETAHPKAKALMKDDFFWSPIDESGPFGSDDGSDAAHGFYQWRKMHRSVSPVDYLTDLVASWKYPVIAWDELDTNRLREYMRLPYLEDEKSIQQQIQLLRDQQKEFAAKGAPEKKALTDEELRALVLKTSKNMGLSFLVGLDESIIGTAFAQIVMEGRLDPKLKYYVTKTLQREQLAVITRNFGDGSQQKAHSDKMRKMLFVVGQMK
jgi:uncharacterized protein YfeS